MPKWNLIHANAQAIPLKSNSVQCIVTSPPYWGLRDYKLGDKGVGLEPTPDLYVQHIVEIFREVKRVLRDDGTLWLNMGDSYAHDNTQRRTIDEQKRESERDVDKGYTAAWQTGTRAGWRDRAAMGVPLGLKPKDLVGMSWRVAFALQADGCESAARRGLLLLCNPAFKQYLRLVNQRQPPCPLVRVHRLQHLPLVTVQVVGLRHTIGGPKHLN